MIECNGQITKTFLGQVENGIYTFFLEISFDNSKQMFGGLQFSGMNGTNVSGYVGQLLLNLQHTFEVDCWEALTNLYVRVRRDDINAPITAVGHIIKDKWFTLTDYLQTPDPEPITEPAPATVEENN